MNIDIESIRDTIAEFESEIAGHESEIARLESEIERKAAIIETLRPAVQAIVDFVEGRSVPSASLASDIAREANKDLSDVESRNSKQRQSRKRLDLGALAERILREANGSWLSYHDVAKIASAMDSRLKGDRRELAKKFNSAMKARTDFEHSGTWFRITGEQQDANAS